MNGLDQAIQLLLTTGKDMKSPVVTPDREPSHVYFIRDIDGSLKKMEAEPTPRKHVATALETIADKAKEFQEEGAEVWASRSGVVLLMDKNRRERAEFALTLSRQIETLQKVAQSNMSQKDIILMLRTTFRDNLGLAGDLVAILRTIKFKNQQSGETSIQQGNVSIGKQLTAQITGTDRLPEYVTFSVPVFAEVGVQSVTAGVECALEPDADTQTFKLIPLSGQIERAIGSGEVQVQALLHGLLDERGAREVPVFLGKP